MQPTFPSSEKSTAASVSAAISISRVPPPLVELRLASASLRESLPALGLRFSFDEIGEALDLREV